MVSDLLRLFGPLAVMAIDWLAVAFNWRRLEYIAKPAAILALLAWLLTYPGPVPGAPLSPNLYWFVAGLLFSLVGDVLLLLPERFFIAGLIAFLLAHVSYIIGLNGGGLLRPILTPVEALVLIPMAFVGGWLMWRIGRALKAGGPAPLRLPVAVYTAVISLMVVSALRFLFEPGWLPIESVFVAAGAVLFFCSDALLAWNRFVAPVRYARLLVIVAYHLGQMLLIFGVVIHILD